MSASSHDSNLQRNALRAPSSPQVPQVSDAPAGLLREPACSAETSIPVFARLSTTSVARLALIQLSPAPTENSRERIKHVPIEEVIIAYRYSTT